MSWALGVSAFNPMSSRTPITSSRACEGAPVQSIPHCVREDVLDIRDDVGGAQNDVFISIAIITDPVQNILITRRAHHLVYGGYWEFPGGKIELNETPEAALIREIAEEINIQIHGFKFLAKFHNLFTYHVYDYHGEIALLADQLDVKWVQPEALFQYQFPDANKQIISFLKNTF